MPNPRCSPSAPVPPQCCPPPPSRSGTCSSSRWRITTSPNPTQILNNPAAPYLNSLMTAGNPNAAQSSYATQYFNDGTGVHPSEPNYVWAEAGTDFGFHSDADPTVANGNIYSAPTLTSQMDAKGISWKNYQEDLQYTSSPQV